MNLMIGAAVLLIVGSGITLVSGWVGEEESLIWTSIGASVVAAVVLAVAYLQSRRAPATGASEPDLSALGESSAVATPVAPPAERAPASRLAWGAPTTEAPAEAEAATETVTATEPAEPAEAPAAASGTAPKPAAKPRKKTTKPETPARTRAATKPAPAATKPSSTRSGEVVAIPERKKFHTTACRYAQGKGEKMTKAVARRRGYEPCGVCKP